MVIGLVMRRQGGPIYDDPYILFRYADHLGAGHGWEFNRNTTSENAVTSSLMVLLLAGARGVGVSVVQMSSVLFFATTFGAAALTGLALDRSGRRTAGALAALLVASSPQLASFRGMESSLYLCLVAGALYTAVSRRPPLVTGLVLGLLVLARPDGAVVGAILVLVFFVSDRERRLERRGWAMLVGGILAPLAVFGGYAVSTFGNPLPSTLAAKVAQRKSGRWDSYFKGGVTELVRGPAGESGSLYWLLLLALLAGAILGLVVCARRQAAWQIGLTLFLATAGLAAFYGLVLDIPAYPWYYALAFYTLVVLAGVGGDRVLSMLASWPAVRWLATVVLAVGCVAVGLQSVTEGPSDLRADYVVVGEWLRDNTDPNATVADMEIGKLGFYSERDMVDYLGLLDSDANDAVARNDFLWWPSHYQPDYWVTMGRWIDEPFASSPCFRRSFEPVFRTDVQVVYRRTRPVPDPSNCE